MKRNSTRKINESAVVNVIATLKDMNPESDMSFLEVGDAIESELVDRRADKDLLELTSIAPVTVESIVDDNVFTLSVLLSSVEQCEKFSEWMYDYGFAASDSDLEEQAPGILAVLSGYDDVIEDDIEESVSTRFAKYRKLYEGEDDEDMSSIFGEDEEKSDDEGEKKDDDEKKEDGEGEGEGEGEDEDNDVPMTAVILTVDKDKAEDCKKELIDAGIDEEYIEILDNDEDEDTAEIKVSVDAIHELKSYLEGKGINLEDEIGGEIVDDEEGEGDKKEGEGESDDDEQQKEIDDVDFGDIFGGDDEGDSDEK